MLCTFPYKDIFITMNLFRYTNIIKNTKRTGNSDKMIASRRKQHQPGINKKRLSSRTANLHC
ncbi:hypothetical protein PARMER_02274 [Parabacteroides merdae ATCC 43184]|nr:hypothetical protein PARMER_02274 [Parabacteroides merdae ATCC 43184]